MFYYPTVIEVYYSSFFSSGLTAVFCINPCSNFLCKYFECTILLLSKCDTHYSLHYSLRPLFTTCLLFHSPLPLSPVVDEVFHIDARFLRTSRYISIHTIFPFTLPDCFPSLYTALFVHENSLS